MFQTFFNAVLLCGVGYTLYKKVIQMLKDIDEKYEGKLKTLVFELEVKHQVSINQLLKDIDEKYELKVNHQESIQKLENTIEYNLEHTETLAIDLNNKLRLLKNKLLDKIKDELKEDEIVDDECSSICLSDLSEDDEEDEEVTESNPVPVPTPESEIILDPYTKKITILGKIYYCKLGRPFQRHTLYELETKKEVGIYTQNLLGKTVELCENEFVIPRLLYNIGLLQGNGMPCQILGKNCLIRTGNIIYDAETKEKVCVCNINNSRTLILDR